MILSSNVYNRFKFLVQIVLPATSTLYFTLGTIWGFPAVEQVIGTLAAVATFLGALVGLSAKNYNASEERFDGQMVFGVDTDSGAKTVEHKFKEYPEVLEQQKEVVLKVVSEEPGE